MTTEELIIAGKQLMDYWLEQTAETVVTRQETRQETREASAGPSDAILKQIISLHLQNPDLTTSQLGAHCDTFVNRWLVGEVLRAGKYTSTGRLTPRIERLRKRLIELGLMSKNPVWE